MLSHLFRKRNEKTKPIKSLTAYLAVCGLGGSFEVELDKTFNHKILYPVSHIPKTPYAKVKIDIIEVNQKYEHERGGSNDERTDKT